MAEEFRDDLKFVIMADVPGLHPDGRSDGSGVPGSDLREGKFTRDIRLPSGTDEWNVTASYTDGVLAVRAPMQSRSAVTRMVPVTCDDPGSPL